MNVANYLRFRDALRGLYLVSQGTTQNFNVRVTGTKEHHGPAGEGFPAYDHFVWRLRREGLTDELVAEAEETLANWKRQPELVDREYERFSLAWKRRVANDDRDIAEVCRLYSVSRWQVYGLRSQYRNDSVA